MSNNSSECSGDEMDMKPSGSEHRVRNLTKRRIMNIDFNTDSDSSQNSLNNNINNNSIYKMGTRNICQQQPRLNTKNGGIPNLETSDDCSSDAEIILRPRIRVKSKLKEQLIDLDNESDVEKPTSSSLTCKVSTTKSDVDEASDSSSNELLEKCPICLLTFRSQNIGSPSTCQHIFCADCIESWSKNMQTCPIDRLLFERIIVRESYKNRKILREINVITHSHAKHHILVHDLEHEEEEDITNCELCQRSDREDVMLLCDSCNCGYHMDCLEPPLAEIPFGAWYCVNCNDTRNVHDVELDVATELSLIIDEMRDIGIPENRFEIRQINQPRILRTRQHERIRAVVLRQTRQSQNNSELTGRTTAAPQTDRNSRRKYKRRRRRVTKKRTYVVEYDLNDFNEKFAIKTTKKVIRKRIKKRNAKKTRVRLSASKKLAEQLGVKKDPTFSSRFPRNGASLSLFGSLYDLEYFSDECDNNGDTGIYENNTVNVGSTMGIQTAVRISNYDPCRKRKNGILSKRLMQTQSSSTMASHSVDENFTNFDILSDIMNIQDRWNNAMRNINSIRINPDGSLNLSNPNTNNATIISNIDKDRRENNCIQQHSTQPNIQRIPLYSRGSGTSNNFNSNYGGNYQNNYSQNYRRSGGGGSAGARNNHNTNQPRNSTGNSTSGNGGNTSFNTLEHGGNYNTNPGNNSQYSSGLNLNRNTFAPFPLRFNPRNQSLNQRQQFNMNTNNNNSINNNHNSNNSSNTNNFNNKQRNSTQFLNSNHNVNNRFMNISSQNSVSSLTQRSSSMSTFQESLPMHQTTSLSMENNNLFSGLPPPICSQPPPISSIHNVNNTIQHQTMAKPNTLGGINVGNINSSGSNSLFSDLPPPIWSQPPLMSNVASTLHNVTLPTPLLMNVPPPPTPPTAVHLNFNDNSISSNSLYQLNTSYGNINDNDANCPNFSVYSQESQEVANSTELNQQPLINTVGDTTINKEDDDNEDLIQLDDDDDDNNNNNNIIINDNNDDIPMPPEPKPNKNEYNKVVVTLPESELYEPENPTEELDEDDDGNDLQNVNNQENNKTFLNESILSVANDNAENDQVIAIEKEVNDNNEKEDIFKNVSVLSKHSQDFDTINIYKKEIEKQQDSTNTESKLLVESNKSNEVEEDKINMKSSASANEATENSQAKENEFNNRKCVLDLYDDSYWDELQVERPKGFTASDHATNKNISEKSDADIIHTPENIEINDGHDKITEPDRSYTPCLDENNEIDDSGGNHMNDGREKSPQTTQIIEDFSNAPKVNNKVKLMSIDKRRADHMETELISDDEYDNQQSETDKSNNNNISKRSVIGEKSSKDNIATFKKVSSKQKERNYRGDKQQQSSKRSKKKRRSSRSREKSNSYSRSRSRSFRRQRSRNDRSRSPRKRKTKGRSRSRSISNKETKNRLSRGIIKKDSNREAIRSMDQTQKKNKRRELPRYDVRNVVKQNSVQRSTKDRYGRDTSRQRRNSRSFSRERRYRLSHSRSRSHSYRRSFSPQERRNRRLSLSLSPSPRNFLRNQSITPPMRRYSPISKRWNSPMNRRSPYRQRSRTPLRITRSRSTSFRDSGIDRRKILNRRRDETPIFSSRKNIRENRTPIISPHYTPQISRSPTKSPQIKIKKKKLKEPRKKKTKRILSSLSPSPHRRLIRQADSFVEIEKPLRKKGRRHSHSPNISAQKKHDLDNEWSPSPSPMHPELSSTYGYTQENNMSWTPPMELPQHNLHEDNTTIFHHDDISRTITPCSLQEKGKRIKKKKKSEKRRGDIRKEKKRKRRTETPDTVPSKEVFASGNNILVSVSFNKDATSSQTQQIPQQQTIVTVPPNREDLLTTRRISIDRLTNSSTNNKKRKEKHKKLDAKPVAIIDLERSPFQIQQEPFDVIVLTDSEDNLNDIQRENRPERYCSESCSKETNEPLQHDKSLEHLNPLHEEESYDIAPSQMGPKTPPEPPLVKFNLQSKKQNKVRNPLHDEEDDDISGNIDLDDHRKAQQNQQQQQDQHRTDIDMAHVTNNKKIGPNTPPESGPYSPDAYDPFEPTKSPSMSPRFPSPPPAILTDVCPSQLSDNNKLIDISTSQKHVGIIDDSHRDQIPAIGGSNSTQGASSLNPVDLVMALMNTKATVNSNQDLVNKSNELQFNSSSINSSINQHDDNIHDKSDDNNTLTVLSNVLISTSASQHIPSISSPTPPNVSKKNLPMPKMGGSVGGSSSSGANIRNGMAQSTEDSFNLNDIESPYSPGSADYEDLFEPPPDTSGSNRRRSSKRNINNSGGGGGGKPEVFDNLFGSSSPIGGHTRMSSTYTPSKRHNKITTSSSRKSKIKVGRSTDDLIKVYDDVPNSAVELQVKDRFLRKLNRQERVVEEVKLVLKPRFNKKQITKEDYKEIMRRAVPKICHSKSGEIDPHKIKNLIEAYVKKFRAKHKKLNLANTGQVSSAVKCAAYLKKL